jgi:putative lipoprotein
MSNKRMPRCLTFSRAVWLFVFACVVAEVAYGEDADMSDMKTIEGSIWYRERMALPSNAEIRVFLEDVARMDAPSDVIATTSILPQGGPPWAFSLAYDPRKLQDRGRYVLRARIEVEGVLMFINTRQIPAFGGNADSRVEILVSRAGGRPPDGGASAPVPDVSLTDTYWKLTEIEGQAATLGAGQREPHMVLTSEGARVGGFSGCNRFTGQYERNESQLGFRPLASTRMACLEGMDQEQRFLQLLATTTRFTIHGDSLALYSGDERLILRFKGVAQQ